ncbi:hemolysin family protein [Hymenobacter sp. GOD-10R]|uniref:hemolysin family protein n=1 Tax=Hymenobacter sp. GOD-10R TaxID=3093922 RepID=UPI002D794360|nr:hemolysin family protein [Hymenobacter sp. GOD-10R]WRQ27391.1 hemolysin family protein [Hymenobacter sp. GOD-10R]
MEILIILLLAILNGVFSMAEIALVSSRKARLETDAQQGNERAKAALALSENPNRFLSTVQIGITLIGILMGVFSGAGLTVSLQHLIEKVEPLRSYSHSIAVVATVGLITYVSVVVGELLPKRIGLINPEGISKIMAGPMSLLSRIAAPFIWLLETSSELLMRLLNIKPKEDNAVTEDEIRSMVREGASSGTIQEVEQNIVNNVFNLGDRRVGSLMTARQDIAWLNINDDVATNKQKVLSRISSMYPLCRGTLDELEGVVYLHDLLNPSLDEQLTRLGDLKKAPLYLPTNSKAYQALEQFKEARAHQGIVVNEFGDIMGVVTINDLFDALVGDVPLPDEEEPDIIQREDGSYLIDAQLPFAEFAERFAIPAAEQQGLTGFHTLGGFVLHILSAIPKTGEQFTWHGRSFEIMDMDKSRIDKILFREKAIAPTQPVEAEPAKTIP